MIGLFYSTEDNSDSLSRNRWYTGNTLIAVLHLRHMLSLSAMLNAHVNMAAGCQGKEMVRLEFHVVFLFSAFMISFGNHVLWDSSYLLLSYTAFSCIILFSGPTPSFIRHGEGWCSTGFLTQSQGACCSLPNSLHARGHHVMVTVPSASRGMYWLIAILFLRWSSVDHPIFTKAGTEVICHQHP